MTPRLADPNIDTSVSTAPGSAISPRPVAALSRSVGEMPSRLAMLQTEEFLSVK